MYACSYSSRRYTVYASVERALRTRAELDVDMEVVREAECEQHTHLLFVSTFALSTSLTQLLCSCALAH